MVTIHILERKQNLRLHVFTIVYYYHLIIKNSMVNGKKKLIVQNASEYKILRYGKSKCEIISSKTGEIYKNIN